MTLRAAQDGDGLWSASEIAAYALGEFDFALPSEALDRMRRQIFEENASAELLQRLKVAVGIARCEAKNALKRQERLEKERLERPGGGEIVFASSKLSPNSTKFNEIQRNSTKFN